MRKLSFWVAVTIAALAAPQANARAEQPPADDQSVESAGDTGDTGDGEEGTMKALEADEARRTRGQAPAPPTLPTPSPGPTVPAAPGPALGAPPPPPGASPEAPATGDLPPGQTPPGQRARTTRETIDQVRAAQRPAVTAAPVEEPMPPPPPRPRVVRVHHHPWGSWWHRPESLRQGDALVFYSIGAFGGGVNQGLGVEALASDSVGIRLSVSLDPYSAGVDYDRDRTQFGFFRNGVPTVPGYVDHAFAHMESAAFTLHPLRPGWIDLFPSVGFSHVGYAVSSEFADVHGGAGYLELGLGMNWFIHRFFIGLDFAWYPIELFHYRSQDIGPPVAYLDDHQVNQTFDGRRARLSGHLGLNF